MADSTKRRWYAFRLRTMLVVVVVLGCALTPLAIKLKKARRQKKAVAWVLENGGRVEYDWQSDDETSPPGPKWFRRVVGDDLFQTVRVVSLAESQVSNLSPLQGLTDLQRVDLWGTAVSDVSPLQGLSNLKELRLTATPVNDLSALTGMTNLQKLILYGTKVTDLSPLAGLTNLRQLFLGRTQVNGILPLQRLSNLCELNLYDANAADEEIRQLQKALPNCNIVR